MMKRAKYTAVALVGAVALMSQFLAGTVAAKDKGRGNNPDLGVVYVTGQGLYYDTFVTTMLPRKGRFQQLSMGTDGPETEFGPGDHGYVGGRWWVDTNMDGEMDDMDTYVSCPLLGPGRTEP
jgi:hypothetical protein